MSTPRHSWKTFLHYVIPSVSAMVLFSAYTIVDGIFVSKGVGELALAGVNIALPFINVLSGTAILLSMGTSTLCAFALGHGDHEKAEKIFTQTVVAIVAISAVITVAVSLFSEPLAVLLGAGPQTVGYSAQYLHMVCLFSVCFILSYCLEVMVKVDGAPQLAMFGVGISFLINVGLDYLFIMVFHWGVWGAALATGLAQLGSLIFFLIYFLSGKSNLRFRRFLRIGEFPSGFPQHTNGPKCQYQSCFSFLSNVAIRSISLSVSAKSKRERFSRRCSGSLEPGITTTPFCRFHRRITCATVFPWDAAISLHTGLFSRAPVKPRPPRGYHPCTTIPLF